MLDMTCIESIYRLVIYTAWWKKYFVMTSFYNRASHCMGQSLEIFLLDLYIILFTITLHFS